MEKDSEKEHLNSTYFPTVGSTLVKEIRNANEHITKSLAAAALPITQIKNVVKAWQESQRLILNQINPLIQMQEVIAEQVKDINNMVRNAFANIDFKRLQEIGQYLADEGVRLDVLMKTGWWYCPSMMNVNSESLKLSALKFRNGDKTAMTKLIVTAYHKDNYLLLRSTVAKWSKNKWFARRMETINDSLGAHIEGKYTLSIPTLLPLVEGIAADYCKDKKISLIGVRNRGNAKVEKAFEELLNTKGRSFKFPDLFIEILNTIIYQDTNKANDPFRKKLNRHGVLHGNYIKYYDAPRSLRCFLLLDALSSLQ